MFAVLTRCRVRALIVTASALSTEGNDLEVNNTVRLLGTHGVPASYGGFETAVGYVAKHLVARGWKVVVYCQTKGSGPIEEDVWQGIDRVLIPVDQPTWQGTGRYDFLSVRHASQFNDLSVVFGYNTAVLNAWQRLKGTRLIFNMDGIEWRRARWGVGHKAILWSNEWVAALLGTRLIADHPEIEKHLLTRTFTDKVRVIAYGAEEITDAPTDPVTDLGLEPSKYLTIICRPMPENSVLELVEGFKAAKNGYKLLILGDYDPDADEYHRAVLEAADEDVVMPGAIFDQEQLASLRFHSGVYLHGHTVGGTNPSLVEAMGAGNAVLARDNKYNRWVVGEGARYFKTAGDVSLALESMLTDESELARLSAINRERYRRSFTWEIIAGQYEALLEEVVAQDSAEGGLSLNRGVRDLGASLSRLVGRGIR